MTYTKANVDNNLSIIPDEDMLVVARKMETAGQIQVARDIARLKAMGEPIYYKIGKKLVREEADGRKFEYRLREDGTEEILVSKNCLDGSISKT
jgi:predicted DNA-binding transcriptional regulator YafY